MLFEESTKKRKTNCGDMTSEIKKWSSSLAPEDVLRWKTNYFGIYGGGAYGRWRLLKALLLTCEILMNFSVCFRFSESLSTKCLFRVCRIWQIACLIDKKPISIKKGREKLRCWVAEKFTFAEKNFLFRFFLRTFTTESWVISRLFYKLDVIKINELSKNADGDANAACCVICSLGVMMKKE